MKRLGVIVLTVAAFALLLVSCGKKDSSVEDPWKEFTSREGKFSVIMPGEPTYTTQTAPTKEGMVQIHMFLIGHGVMAYGIIYNDVPGAIADVQKYLDERRNGAVLTSKGTLISEKKISIEGHPGREIKLKTADNMQYTGRLYFIDGRFYQVIVTAPAEVNAEAVSAKFLDSFKLL